MNERCTECGAVCHDPREVSRHHHVTCSLYPREGGLEIERFVAEESLEALLVRVRWYVCRGYEVPVLMRRAFNVLCDLTKKPHDRPWQRFA